MYYDGGKRKGHSICLTDIAISNLLADALPPNGVGCFVRSFRSGDIQSLATSRHFQPNQHLGRRT